MTVSISVAGDADREEWERYQQERRLDHHAFSWPWRAVLEAAFGHRPYYLIARRGSVVCGLLPLFHVKSVLFGSALISVPYLNGGGILADSGEEFDALLRSADDLAGELNARYLELRHREALSEARGDLTVRSHKVAMRLALTPQAEDLFNSFPPKLRSQIRRPRKSGMEAQLDRAALSTDAALAAFFSVFSEHMRDLGTPVFPRRLFSAAKHYFGERCRIVTVWHQDKPVAAGITIRNGRAAEIPWAAALRRYNQHSPNMLLYWECMKAACEDGCELFDFGRSSYDTGPYRFKLQWKPESLPLHWYYHVRKGELPNVSPSNPKYSALVRCWQRLPLTAANVLGPWITRSLP